jgi:hypothetical protein
MVSHGAPLVLGIWELSFSILIPDTLDIKIQIFSLYLQELKAVVCLGSLTAFLAVMRHSADMLSACSFS